MLTHISRRLVQPTLRNLGLKVRGAWGGACPIIIIVIVVVIVTVISILMIIVMMMMIIIIIMVVIMIMIITIITIVRLFIVNSDHNHDGSDAFQLMMS